MTLDEIKELIQLVLDSGVAELEVARGDSRVRIKRSADTTTQEIVLPAQASANPAPAPQYNPPQQAPAQPPAEPPPPKPEDEGLEYVKSPIVGTFYEAPAPDADPFVKVSDQVSPGQVLCIIESMKLMNEIESEMAGTVVRKLVENGRPVEYGEALFAIRPN